MLPEWMPHEIGGLHEHPAGAAARVVHPALERLQNLDKGPHDTGRGVEFPGAFTLLLCEFGKAVFVGTAQDVLIRTVFYHLYIGEQVNDVPKVANDNSVAPVCPVLRMEARAGMPRGVL